MPVLKLRSLFDRLLRALSCFRSSPMFMPNSPQFRHQVSVERRHSSRFAKVRSEERLPRHSANIGLNWGLKNTIIADEGLDPPSPNTMGSLGGGPWSFGEQAWVSSKHGRCAKLQWSRPVHYRALFRIMYLRSCRSLIRPLLQQRNNCGFPGRNYIQKNHDDPWQSRDRPLRTWIVHTRPHKQTKISTWDSVWANQFQD